MTQIKVFSKNGTRLGSTSKAFDIVVREELMREHTLAFSVANIDSVFSHIAPDTIYECEGERFDITDINGDNTGVNTTTVSAEHVSYRLNEYTIPANYAFVGTVQEIGNDILKVSGAVAEFSIGEYKSNTKLSFALNNDKETTARAAIIALQSMGVEITFNNFTINFSERLGEDKQTPLYLSRRQWQKGNGWTYEVDIADTGNITLGDTFPLVGDGIEAGTTKRIIAHERHLDDPTQNTVTLGVFVRDDASSSVEIENKVDNSVQQGEKYSNVKITHTDGFVAENKAGTQRVIMNADDCFTVQVKRNGEWVSTNTLEDFGLIVNRITNPEAKNKFYISVGEIGNNEYGLQLHKFIDGKDTTIAEIGQVDGYQNLTIKSLIYPITLEAPKNNAISVITNKGNTKILNSDYYKGIVGFKKPDDTIGYLHIVDGEIHSVD